MAASQRTKGRRIETQARHLLEDHHWRCIDTSPGMTAEDLVAEDPQGRRWSVEVTADQTISLATKWAQTLRQAQAREAWPLLLWRFDRADWWAVADATPVMVGVTPVFHPPASWHPRRLAQTWATWRQIEGHGPVFVVGQDLAMVPAEDLLGAL